MYYDPVVEHNNPGGTMLGLGVAFYTLPQDRELAWEMYRAVVAENGWAGSDNDGGNDDAPEALFRSLGGGSQLAKCALLLAQEFGDVEVAARLRTGLEYIVEGTTFGEDGSEFGFFSHVGEDWPRGQSSALMMCAELMSEGAWSKAFNDPRHADRFAEPTVEGIDFPTLGVCAAQNDLLAGTLRVRTYAATPSARGATTHFKVTRLPAAATADAGHYGLMTVTCDGAAFSGFEVVGGSGSSSIEVTTTVGEHEFVFHTGYRGAVGDAAAARL
jgi:hypothetical protein